MKRLILIILAVLLIPSKEGTCKDNGLSLFIPNMIKAAEMKYDIPRGLLKALIQVESNGRYLAMNHDDGNKQAKEQGTKIKSHGLVQMQIGTAKLIQLEKAKTIGRVIAKKDTITVKELMNPETNIEYGAMYLKWLLNNHDNDVSWALTCYNSGPYSRMCKNKIYYGRYVGKILNAMLKTE